MVGVFWWARPNTFTSVGNFANFLEQASAVTVIAMAVTFVLLLGEIDLAAGFTAGIAAGIAAAVLAIPNGLGLIGKESVFGREVDFRVRA